MCLGKLLSHTPAQRSLMLSAQLQANCCLKGNQELLNSTQEREHIVFRRSKHLAKMQYLYPQFLSECTRFANFCKTSSALATSQANESFQRTLCRFILSKYHQHFIMFSLSSSNSKD